MKKLKKLFIFLALIIIVSLTNKTIFAISGKGKIENVEYSEKYKEYLELSDEEKQNVVEPRMFDIKNAKKTLVSPLYLARMIGSSLSTNYSLKNVIPENLKIRNQKSTGTCWAFYSLSSLETNLALSNYYNNKNTDIVYDYSERHLEYATSQSFLNNQKNKFGYNRKVGSGGNFNKAISYLTNGSGAIDENSMPFEDNESDIDISQIQGKVIISELYDTVEFEDYQKQGQNKTEIMNKIKEHVKNYGSVAATIHGDGEGKEEFNCYNNKTGAIYCNSSDTHVTNHGVSIIGWDDNYPVENFNEGNRPNSKGAWIIRNSWGEKIEYDLKKLKETIFNNQKEYLQSHGYQTAESITNELLEKNGYIIEGEKAYYKLGDNGIMYISYEDCNVSKNLNGILKAKDSTDYDYIYQYDILTPNKMIKVPDTNKATLCSVFTKESQSKEYLKQVSIYAPETYICKVYVNASGEDKSTNSLKAVTLKAGDSETIDAGYHTLEFAKPVEITGEKFAVAVEIEAKNQNSINILYESKEAGTEYSEIETESQKCFIKYSGDTWNDFGDLKNVSSGTVKGGDPTIKAFTSLKENNDSVDYIKITNQPSKVTYYEGEDFDKTGMEVTAYLRDETTKKLNDSDYEIMNGSKLSLSQDSVTISYEGKTAKQSITVNENPITELKITKEPTKLEYYEGENFDPKGMVVEAEFGDGNKKVINDYKIVDGNNLKVNQKKVDITYKGKTVSQSITVIPNPLLEIRIKKQPDKVKYVVGQNFDKKGMIVTGLYEDGKEREIINYNVRNGTNLQLNQNTVIIEYDGKTVEISITVEEKIIVDVSIDKKPSKLKYIKNKEKLDLTGGTLKIKYNDDTTEIISMTSDEITVEGFSNKELGKIIITLIYHSKRIQFNIEIIEEQNVEKAINSDLSKIKVSINEIKAYYYTQNDKEEYTLINVEVNNFTKVLTNDRMEYYYYVSTNANEKNITDWVKIDEEQKENNKLKFTIDSRNITDYANISREDVLYLYIKEVAIKGGNQSIEISNSVNLQTEKVDVYIDDIKQKEPQSSNKENNDAGDKSVASGKLPQTGVKATAIVIFVTIIVSGIIFSTKYFKYRDIK